MSRAAGIGLGTAVLALGSAFGGGCYQRTIRAEGPGADRTAVQEPYQESSALDDLLFGPLRTEQKESPK